MSIKFIPQSKLCIVERHKHNDNVADFSWPEPLMRAPANIDLAGGIREIMSLFSNHFPGHSLANTRFIIRVQIIPESTEAINEAAMRSSLITLFSLVIAAATVSAGKGKRYSGTDDYDGDWEEYENEYMPTSPQPTPYKPTYEYKPAYEYKPTNEYKSIAATTPRTTKNQTLNATITVFKTAFPTLHLTTAAYSTCYTTVYNAICEHDVCQKTHTITEYCPTTCPTARPEPHIPQGYTTSVTVCNHCSHPTTLTLTYCPTYEPAYQTPTPSVMPIHHTYNAKPYSTPMGTGSPSSTSHEECEHDCPVYPTHLSTSLRPSVEPSVRPGNFSTTAAPTVPTYTGGASLGKSMGSAVGVGVIALVVLLL
ncbi:hypothetical protein RUND412_001973 [Rhizina undulata]